MGKKLGSYLDSDRTNVGWLEPWKKDGLLVCWLHREPPSMRSVHNFRRVAKEETKDGLKVQLRWYPFSCWEDESYHKALRLKQEASAKVCPACKMLEHLRERTDIANDETLFKFKAGKEIREILKADFLGTGTGRDSFQDSFVPKSDYIIAVIPNDKPEEVMLTNEPWSVFQGIQQCIRTDMKVLKDEEAANPAMRPICYTFQALKEGKGPVKYAVSRLAEAKLTPKIQELWESEAPDTTPFIRGGDPTMLLAAMESSIQFDCDLSNIFETALKEWKKTHKTEDADPLEPDEEEEEAPKPKSTNHSKNAVVEEVEDEEEEEEEAPKPKSKKPPQKESEPTKSERPVRPTKAPAPVPKKPDPKKNVTVFACEGCGADWPEDEPACPKCGLEAAESEERTDALDAADMKRPPNERKRDVKW